MDPEPDTEKGQPGIAQAALFVMQNAFMTGAVIHVDGGDKLV